MALDLDDDGVPPLAVAARGGDVEAVAALVGDDKSLSELRAAALESAVRGHGTLWQVVAAGAPVEDDGRGPVGLYHPAATLRKGRAGVPVREPPALVSTSASDRSWPSLAWASCRDAAGDTPLSLVAATCVQRHALGGVALSALWSDVLATVRATMRSGRACTATWSSLPVVASGADATRYDGTSGDPRASSVKAPNLKSQSQSKSKPKKGADNASAASLNVPLTPPPSAGSTGGGGGGAGAGSGRSRRRKPRGRASSGGGGGGSGASEDDDLASPLAIDFSALAAEIMGSSSSSDDEVAGRGASGRAARGGGGGRGGSKGAAGGRGRGKGRRRDGGHSGRGGESEEERQLALAIEASLMDAPLASSDTPSAHGAAGVDSDHIHPIDDTVPAAAWLAAVPEVRLRVMTAPTRGHDGGSRAGETRAHLDDGCCEILTQLVAWGRTEMHVLGCGGSGDVQVHPKAVELPSAPGAPANTVGYVHGRACQPWSAPHLRPTSRWADRDKPASVDWKVSQTGCSAGVCGIGLDGQGAGVSNVMAVSTGVAHSAAVTTTGHLYVWGSTGGGRLGLEAVATAPGDRGRATSDDDEEGEDGAGDGGGGRAPAAAKSSKSEPSRPPFVVTPQLHPHFSRPAVGVGGGVWAVAVSCGAAHTLVLDAAGGVWAWGENRAGACGTAFSTAAGGALAPSAPVTSPARVEGGGLGRCTAVSVAAGGDHSIVVTSDGHAWSWGSNVWGQLGQRDVPTAAALLRLPRDAVGPTGASDSRPPAAGTIPGAVGGIATWLAARLSPDGPARCARAVPGRVDVGAGLGPQAAAAGGGPGRFVTAAASHTYSCLVTAGGDVAMAGHGSAAWVRVACDEGAASQSDAIAAAMESSACAGDPPLPGRSLAAEQAAAAAALRGRGFPVDHRLGAAGGLEGDTVAGAAPPADDTVDGWSIAGSVGGGSGRAAIVRHVSAGPHHAVAVDQDGGVWCWGDVSRPELRSCVASAVVKGDVVAIGSAGHPVAWKPGLAGPRSTSVPVLPPPAADGPPMNAVGLPLWSGAQRVATLSRAGVRAVQAGAGSHHTAIVTTCGDVWMWGSDTAHTKGLLASASSGPLAAPAASDHAPASVLKSLKLTAIPRRITSVAQAVSIAVGDHHTLALTATCLPPPPPLRPHVADVADALCADAGRGSVAVEDAATGCAILVSRPIDGGDGTGPTCQVALLPPARRPCHLPHPKPAHETHAYPLLLDEVRQAAEWAGSGIRKTEESAAPSDPTLCTMRLVPSLRSLAERAVAVAVRTPATAAGLLLQSQAVGATGLASHCAAVIGSNMPAALAAHKGKGWEALVPLAPALLHHTAVTADQVHRLRHVAETARAAAAERHRQMRRYEYELLRPGATWRGAVQGRVQRGGGQPASASGCTPAAAAAAAAVAAQAGLSDALLDVIARDVAATRNALFPREATHRHRSTDVGPTAAGGGVDRGDVPEAHGVATEGGVSFHDVFAGIQARHRGDTLPHQPLFDSALSLVLARLPPTTLPPTSAAGLQSSVDRLAANLVELGAAPAIRGESMGPQAASRDGWDFACPPDATLRLPASLTPAAARALITDILIDVTLGLLRRTKALRKRVVDATETLWMNGGGLMAASEQGMPPADPLAWCLRIAAVSTTATADQMTKVHRRMDAGVEMDLGQVDRGRPPLCGRCGGSHHCCLTRRWRRRRGGGRGVCGALAGHGGGGRGGGERVPPAAQ